MSLPHLRLLLELRQALLLAMICAVLLLSAALVLINSRPYFEPAPTSYGFCATVSPEDGTDFPEKAHLGKALFRSNCAACHAKDMRTPFTGPALGGVTERWADYPREDLYAFIRNSQELIRQGHPRAQALWEKWQPTVMNAFPNLTDEEVDGIVYYIDLMENGF